MTALVLLHALLRALRYTVAAPSVSLLTTTIGVH